MAYNQLYYSMFTRWTSCDTAGTNVILLTFLLMCYVGKKLWIDVFLKTTKKSK
ncbi:multisubunit Na+/H+ antiporter MnhF subunit [Mucilaginibacter pocheonensis]|uniref:Multisubunit Na+/H+ antiporter MnhF subunit n=1 Tax=Mucilaginibacter pocheonensis TaxID=398050 RepID=A0ABU1TE09_9SPHI|nr:multisubunit Na+/H+ antiporter MnhF subunit [Mucilaginibacter pocheonensis]